MLARISRISKDVASVLLLFFGWLKMYIFFILFAYDILKCYLSHCANARDGLYLVLCSQPLKNYIDEDLINISPPNYGGEHPP